MASPSIRQLLSFGLFSFAAASPLALNNPAPTHVRILPKEAAPAPSAGSAKLEVRQQAPFSISSVIASTVDPKFYSIQNAETNYVGPNTAALSTNTATVTSGGSAATKAVAAQMGIFTATVNGKKEYSVYVAPDLAAKMQKIVYDSSLSTEDIPTANGVFKRGLPTLPPASVVRFLINLVGPELAASFIKVYNVAASSTEVAAIGATAAGYVPVIGAAIEVGGVFFSAVTFLETYAKLYMSFKNIDRNTPKGFPKSVVINLDDLKPKDQKQCAKDIQCADCGGVNGVCTVSNTGCVCQNKDKNQCPKKDGTNNKLPIDCNDSKCKHNDQRLCTAEPNKNCPCAFYGAADRDSYKKDMGEVFKHLQQIFDKKGGTKEPGKMACSANSAKILPQWFKLEDGSSVRPQDIFYRMRDTLCNNKCESPPNLAKDAVRATPDGEGCEIAVGSYLSNEIFAYRQTASKDSNIQDCWDAFANITDSCIQNGPNTGWSNGPSAYQFYQMGVREQGKSDQQKHKDKINVSLKTDFILCSSCGGPDKGGKCSGSDGKHPNELCCPKDSVKCSDSRCKAQGGLCTGELNGCLCSFN
ncbi:hypothetical protein GQ43DRAFT_462195 [Delitschia confertaspora ATCC 74209]|uniref:Uncharacterized protein n=1 Tax=Delitschia confertaspora ATCC 74209 TaxID=1513339 RepID=A0A9P4JNB2_9PLEO|nr:hypothetical protein GQ43DRAFT_462195 [Delitschia confertaspora ATCC 74209]